MYVCMYVRLLVRVCMLCKGIAVMFFMLYLS